MINAGRADPLRLRAARRARPARRPRRRGPPVQHPRARDLPPHLGHGRVADGVDRRVRYRTATHWRSGPRSRCSSAGERSASDRAVVPGPRRATVHRVRAALAAHDADRLLVTSPPNVRYLSGFAGSNGQVIVGADAAGTGSSPTSATTARATSEAPDLEVVLTRDPFARRPVGRPRRSAVEADHLTWSAAERLRARAEEAGLELVATTGSSPASGRPRTTTRWRGSPAPAPSRPSRWRSCSRRRSPSARDRTRLATWLERRFVDLGADGVAFPSIVAAGPNGARPAPRADRPAPRDGDLLTVDCGAEVGGYHADCTRTVGRRGSGRDRSMCTTSWPGRPRRGVGRGASQLSGGAAPPTRRRRAATGGDVDAARRDDHLEAAGLRRAFVHGTGHGVGLEVHEAPAVAQGSSATLGRRDRADRRARRLPARHRRRPHRGHAGDHHGRRPVLTASTGHCGGPEASPVRVDGPTGRAAEASVPVAIAVVAASGSSPSGLLPAGCSRRVSRARVRPQPRREVLPFERAFQSPHPPRSQTGTPRCTPLASGRGVLGTSASLARRVTGTSLGSALGSDRRTGARSGSHGPGSGHGRRGRRGRAPRSTGSTGRSATS